MYLKFKMTWTEEGTCEIPCPENVKTGQEAENYVRSLNDVIPSQKGVYVLGSARVDYSEEPVVVAQYEPQTMKEEYTPVAGRKIKLDMSWELEGHCFEDLDFLYEEYEELGMETGDGPDLIDPCFEDAENCLPDEALSYGTYVPGSANISHFEIVE